MPGNAKCFVPFCTHPEENNKCLLSLFPYDQDRCKEWVRAVGQRDFLHLTMRFLSRNRYFCGCHFKENDYLSCRQTRLKKSAIPSIFDNRITAISDDEMIQFPPKDPIIVPCIQKKIPCAFMKKANEESGVMGPLANITYFMANLPLTFIDTTMSMDIDYPIDTGTIEVNISDERLMMTIVRTADNNDNTSNEVLSKKKKFRPSDIVIDLISISVTVGFIFDSSITQM